MKKRFPGRKSGTIRIAYVLNMFPLLSESFINNEVIGLRQRGLHIVTYALNPPPEGKANPDMMFLQDSTFYIIPYMRFKRLLAGHFYFLLRFPRRYLRTFLFAFTRRSRSESLLSTIWRLTVHKQEPTKPQRQNVLLHFLLIAPVARRMLKGRFELIHAHYADSAAGLALLASMLLKAPFSFTAHAYDIFTPQAIFTEKLTRAHFMVTCTQYNRDYLLQRHPQIDPAKLIVNLHGIDLSRFRREPQRPSAPPLLVTVCRLVAKKGIAILIHACKLLKEQGVDFRCRIIGDGPERPKLEMQIRLNHLLDRVEITGLQPQAQVIEAYQQARLFVLPCIVGEDGNRDGIPNVLAEAMAMEVPVISTAISGIPQLIQDGVSGVLLQQADAVKLAEVIAELLSSPKKRARLIEAGRQRVEEIFDARKNLDQLKDIFASQLRP